MSGNLTNLTNLTDIKNLTNLNNTNLAITTKNLTQEEINLNNELKTYIFEVVLLSSVGSLIILPFLIAVLTKLFKKMNTYVESYNRILTIMISESIYELQFMQNLACIRYIEVDFNKEAMNTFTYLSKFVYLDYLDHLVYDPNLANGLPKNIQPEFVNRFFRNNQTFSILILYGILALFVIFIRYKIKNKDVKKVEMGKIQNEKENSNQKEKEKGIQNEEVQNEEKHENDDNIVVDENNINNLQLSQETDELKHLQINIHNPKLKKCTVESNREYFLFNYFIRVYQITFIKVNFSCFLVLNNSGLETSDRFEVFTTWMVLIFWVCGVPAFLFLHLRSRQKILMSPEMVVKFGTLYANYRGITKDVYAFILQVKFFILPMISIYFYQFPIIQIILMIVLYVFNVIFITFSTPFCKVSKVFTEAISEGLIVAFFIQILLNQLSTWIKQKTDINDIVTISLLLVILSVRSFRIGYDTVLRVRDLIRIKQPVVVGVDTPYIIRPQKLIEVEKEEEEEKNRKEKEEMEKALEEQDYQDYLKNNQSLKDDDKNSNENNDDDDEDNKEITQENKKENIQENKKEIIKESVKDIENIKYNAEDNDKHDQLFNKNDEKNKNNKKDTFYKKNPSLNSSLVSKTSNLNAEEHTFFGELSQNTGNNLDMTNNSERNLLDKSSVSEMENNNSIIKTESYNNQNSIVKTESYNNQSSIDQASKISKIIDNVSGTSRSRKIPRNFKKDTTQNNSNYIESDYESKSRRTEDKLSKNYASSNREISVEKTKSFVTGVSDNIRSSVSNKNMKVLEDYANDDEEYDVDIEKSINDYYKKRDQPNDINEYSKVSNSQISKNNGSKLNSIKEKAGEDNSSYYDESGDDRSSYMTVSQSGNSSYHTSSWMTATQSNLSSISKISSIKKKNANKK